MKSLGVVGLVALLLCRSGGSPRAARTARAHSNRTPSRFSKVDGIRVHYKTLGTGETALVFVHGWTCDLTFWRDQVPYFEGRTRIVLVDLPGHGRSDKPNVDYTQDLFARGVHAALQDAGVTSAVLVGHSMGTPVVRQFYRLFPTETRALVAVDATLLDPVPDLAARQERLRQFYSPAFRVAMANMVDCMFVPQTSPEIRQFVKPRMMQAPQWVAAGALKGLADPTLWKPDPIDVPLLAIMAKARNWSPEQEASFRTIVPHVDYHAMEGVGHFLMMEQPQAFNMMLAQFLTQHGFLKPLSLPRVISSQTSAGSHSPDR